MKTPLFVALSLLPCLAFAETSPTAPSTASSTTAAPHSTVPDPAKELATMTERLKLTPAQQDEIKPLLVAEADKRKAILNDTSLTPQQKHEQTGAVHRASLQQIKTYFTPAQMAQIEQGMNHPVPGTASSTAK